MKKLPRKLALKPEIIRTLSPIQLVGAQGAFEPMSSIVNTVFCPRSTGNLRTCTSIRPYCAAQ